MNNEVVVGTGGIFILTYKNSFLGLFHMFIGLRAHQVQNAAMQKFLRPIFSLQKYPKKDHFFVNFPLSKSVGICRLHF